MTPIRAMIDLLEVERQILMTGDYGSLDDLLCRKTELSKRLNGVSTDEDLPELARHAARNAGMIAAARQGFESAKLRIRDIKEGRSQSTYSQDGSRRSLSKVSGRVEQKL